MQKDEGDPGPERVVRAAALRPNHGAVATASTTKRAAEPGGGTHTNANLTDVIIRGNQMAYELDFIESDWPSFGEKKMRNKLPFFPFSKLMFVLKCGKSATKCYDYK